MLLYWTLCIHFTVRMIWIPVQVKLEAQTTEVLKTTALE